MKLPFWVVAALFTGSSWFLPAPVPRLCEHLQRIPGTDLCTHGGDAGCLVRCVPLVFVNPPPKAPCLGDGISGKRIQLIYGQVLGEYDESSQAIPLIRNDADNINEQFRELGNQNVRWLCNSGGQIVTKIVFVGRTLKAVIATLQAKGYSRSDRIYVVSMKNGDATTAGYSAVGTIDNDDRATNNANDVGPAYSVIYSYLGWPYMWHELTHNLGGVQLSAPHSSGAWHCWDQHDLLCYKDGGSYFRNGGQLQNRCPGGRQYDCGKDDYFSSNPSGYLATHWNLFHSSWLEVA